MYEIVKLLNGHTERRKIIPMPPDGSCLFHSISFCVYDSLLFSEEVRSEIVNFVLNNWDTYEVSCVNLFVLHFKQSCRACVSNLSTDRRA